MRKNFSVVEMNKEELSELVGSISFFNRFPEDIVGGISDLIEVIAVDPGEEILAQGEINDSLYFLVNGLVTVIVDGGVVAKLRRRGDLIGEMSVLSSEPCAASIICETPVRLLRLKAEDFTKLTASAEGGEFQVLLYQRYAASLTEKLRDTNHKAKVVEEMNRALEEAKSRLEDVNARLEVKVAERTKDLKQKAIDLLASHQKLENKNVELMASYKKMEEVFSTQDLTFTKLETLYKGGLIPLKDTLIGLKQAMKTPEEQAELAKAISEVEDLRALLEPIVERIDLEKEIAAKKVLVAEPLKKQQMVAKMALRGTGVGLDIVCDIESGMEKLRENEYDIIFVDLTLVELAEKAHQLNLRSKFVFMTSEDIKSYLPTLQSATIFPNIVSRNVNDRSFTIKNIMTTVSKLISKDIFGLEKYLTWGVDVQESMVVSSVDRSDLVQQVSDYFSEMGMRRSTRDSCCTVVEELLMNAIYDAPVDTSGKPKYNHLDRTEVVQLGPSEQAKIRYASDGVLMGVSVEDPFGKLTQKIVLDYLETCYGERAGELNEEKGGAGRGLHQIIVGSDMVVFNVAEGQKTEVIALFEASPNRAEEKHPSFHFFYQ